MNMDSQRMISRTRPRPIFIASTDQKRSQAQLRHSRKRHQREKERMVMCLDEGHILIIIGSWEARTNTLRSGAKRAVVDASSKTTSKGSGLALPERFGVEREREVGMGQRGGAGGGGLRSMSPEIRCGHGYGGAPAWLGEVRERGGVDSRPSFCAIG